LRDGKGSLVTVSLIEDNIRDGIKVMGGRDHIIRGNTINRNSIGISIDALYGDHREVIVPMGNNVSQLQVYASMLDSAVSSQDIIVEENEVRGNEKYGIFIVWKARNINLTNNQVYNTGKERTIDKKETAYWGNILASSTGTTGFSSPEELGTGIMIRCLPQYNIVNGNHVHDNIAFGIGLAITYHNQISKNLIERNKVGISLNDTNNNKLHPQ